MKKEKIIGLIGLTISAIVSTLATAWMTDREVEAQVKKAIKEKENEES